MSPHELFDDLRLKVAAAEAELDDPNGKEITEYLDVDVKRSRINEIRRQIRGDFEDFGHVLDEWNSVEPRIRVHCVAEYFLGFREYERIAEVTSADPNTVKRNLEVRRSLRDQIDRVRGGSDAARLEWFQYEKNVFDAEE